MRNRNIRCKCVELSLAFLAVSFFINGCAAKDKKEISEIVADAAEVVKVGDAATIEFDCFLENGRLTITTDPSVGELTADKANIYLDMQDPGPVQVEAGDKVIRFMHTRTSPRNFEDAVSAYLADEIIGHPYDQELELKIDGEVQKSLTESERFLKLYRHQQLNKEKEVAIAALEAAEEKEIHVGYEISTDEFPGIYYDVVEMKEDEDIAVIRIKFEDGTTREHDFGRIRYMNVDEDTYEMIIDNEVGYLIRSGELVGRVSEVTDRYFIIDYGHPFGGECMVCKVKAKKK